MKVFDVDSRAGDCVGGVNKLIALRGAGDTICLRGGATRKGQPGLGKSVTRIMHPTPLYCNKRNVSATGVMIPYGGAFGETMHNLNSSKPGATKPAVPPWRTHFCGRIW